MPILDITWHQINITSNFRNEGEANNRDETLTEFLQCFCYALFLVFRNEGKASVS